MIEYYKNKNVLITGGLGFLGSSIAERLVNSGATITLIDNLHPLYGGNKFNVESIKDKVNVLIEDIRNEDIMAPLIQKADLIFHLAAQVSYIDSLSIPFEDLDLNAQTTLKILENCRKLNPKVRVVFSSSRMVYGKVNQPIVTENSETNPLSLYGIHKLTSEKYLLMYFKDFGIPTTVLRLTNPYGPKQQIKHSKYSLVGWFIRQAMEGNTIKIYGDGQQLRDYVYVNDIVEAMIRSAASEQAAGEVINVGSGVSSKFSDMVHDVVKIVGNGNIEFIPWPENYEKVETGDISVDISKLSAIANWNPKYTLIDGIQETFSYYKKNISHYI
ncbi:MAG: NAD-dependent epimerase/dehydratase family protein [Melioribacteraceae bacterium]|nr:NAD-dependent epimerase/dehydratase family protein [Melioribacteraceae bacterium]